MKTLGFILIGIQLFAYVSGNSNRGGDQSFAYMLGYNSWGIIGLVLLVIAYNKENKNSSLSDQNESESQKDNNS